MAPQRRDTRIDHFFDQLFAQLRESPTPLTTSDPMSLSSAHPPPEALPDTSPNLALMRAIRQRRRMHHSSVTSTTAAPSGSAVLEHHWCIAITCTSCGQSFNDDFTHH